MLPITLRQALSVLAKSSPFAVCTRATSKQRDSLDELKDYLFIPQQIERDFEQVLGALEAGDVVFLCGSSGDGKSEILTRHSQKYSARYRFHLDATHSFTPSQSAIEALDKLFDERNGDSRPLVIGINVGMLANYANEGSDRHVSVRHAIDLFLAQQISEKPHYFLDFEKYPKFDFNAHGEACSDFAKELMRRLTVPESTNPFFILTTQKNGQDEDEKRLIANIRLMARESVQDCIITNLLKIRLAKDQFVTTRALLDFFHHLLTGDGYLFDNLFCGSENELVQRTMYFDPATKRTQKLDQFILRYELHLPDPQLDSLLAELETHSISFSSTRSGKAASIIRLFYLLSGETIGNNYHHEFAAEFQDRILEQYAKIWLLHENYRETIQEKNQLRQFYVHGLISAIYTYANRNAPDLARGELFLGQLGPVRLAAPIELKTDYSRIASRKSGSRSSFFAYLKIGEATLPPIQINYNLFELVQRLNNGYRPNRYDKSSIVMLDEIVEHIVAIAKTSQKLKFYERGHEYSASLEEDMISVAGV